MDKMDKIITTALSEVPGVFNIPTTKIPIYLTYLNGTGYVFNVDDYMKLRMEHRVVGNLVGSSALRGSSVTNSNLPVELTKFETQLLVDKGIAVLIKKTSLKESPSKETIEQYIESFENRILEQADCLKEKRLEKCKQNIEKIMLGKKKKLVKAGICENEIQIAEEDIMDDFRSRIKFDRNHSLLEIPNQHIFEHTGEIVKFDELSNCFRYRVFKALWEKGNFITCGDAFGADFISYPGDPKSFHASHIIMVLNDSKIKPIHLIGKCRLSVIVNKICVFAYESENGEISYQTVKWGRAKDKIK